MIVAIYKSDIVDINLESGSINRSFMKHSIGTADQAADRIGIRAFRDGVPEDLSGASCYGYFRNSQGTNIALTNNGTINGNEAYVTLPQACYDYEGNFTLTIKLLVSGVTSTVRIVDGVVDNTNTGDAVAPTSAVPSYSEILSQYDAMVAATAVANGAIATTFNAATVYPAGSYVINNGALYRITADHAANVTWENTSKVETKIGNEVSDLESALVYDEDANAHGYAEGLPGSLFEINRINPATGNSNTTDQWIRTKDFIHATKELYIDIITATAMQIYILPYKRSDGSYDASKCVEVRSDSVVLLDDAYKYKITMAYTTVSTISNAEQWYNSNVKIYGTPISIAQYEKNITNLQKSTKLYPFACLIDTVLYRPGYEQTVYSADLNGIENLLISTPSEKNFYVKELYSYHATNHTSVLKINAEDDSITFSYTSSAWSSQDARGKETISIIGSDGISVLNATIDWARINTNKGLDLTIAAGYQILEQCIKRLDMDNAISFWAIPSTVYALVGEESRIYFNEILATTKDGFFEITVTGATYPEVTYSSEYISLNFTSAKSCTIAISYQDKTRNEITAKTITVTALATLSTIPAKKYMFLGDSLTNEGTMASTFKTLIGNSATLYGTRTSKGVNHEGRPGWGISHYCDNQTYNGITNPFYNPTSHKFDFSYYMTNNPSFADVDVVNVFLGRNNGYGVSYIARLFDEIIASIKEYNSNIIVTVMWAYNTATDNSGAGKSLQNTYRMIYNGKAFNAAMIEETLETGVYIVPENLNLDNYYDYAREEVNATPYTTEKRIVFTDNVHPKDSGFIAWAHTLFTYIQKILE